MGGRLVGVSTASKMITERAVTRVKSRMESKIESRI
jgi:hypothetical protein